MTKPETWCALQELTADYWRRVDRLSEDPVDELYVENGTMQIGSLKCEGRDQIRAFFADRNSKEKDAKRTTRHLVSGLSIVALSPSRFRLLSTVQVLSGCGGLPLASAPPSSVGDFEDVVINSPQGAWLFESRSARIVFVGIGAAAFAR